MAVVNVWELTHRFIICWRYKIKCVICRKMYFIKRLKQAALFWRGWNYGVAWNIRITVESGSLEGNNHANKLE